MFYLATNEHGRGIRVITAFDDKRHLLNYADDVTACTDTTVNKSDTISEICEKLYDMGPGFGARNHYRVDRTDAIALIKNGATGVSCWNLRR
jgi:uncharacterized phage-like protein YoqJ